MQQKYVVPKKEMSQLINCDIFFRIQCQSATELYKVSRRNTGENAKITIFAQDMNTKRYTPEEFAFVKETAKNTLDYGRKNIIGKYEFNNPAFGGVPAKFTRNSFQENLRFGEAFDDKVEMLKIIDNLLKEVTFDRFEENAKLSQKPDVKGYFVFKGEYKNNDVEYFFEKRKDTSIIFHFIKLHKKQPN